MAYDPNWRQKAINEGKDQNSPEFASFRAQEQGGSSMSESQNSGPSINMTDAIQKAIDITRKSIEPQIQSYQAQIPEIQKQYTQKEASLTSQKQTLGDRYKNLLASIKGQGAESVNKQTLVTANELGKRGITGDSTLAQQEIINSTEPVKQKYVNLEQQTATDQSEAERALNDTIAGLTTSRVADERSIQNAIAQLLSGASTQGIQLGTNLYNTNQQAQLAQQELEAKQAQQKIANDLAQKELELKAKQTAYDTSKPYSTSVGGDPGIASLFALLGQGGANTPRYSVVPGPNAVSRPSLNSFIK